MRRSLHVLAIAFAASRSLTAQTPPAPESSFIAVERTATSELARLSIPGMAIAIVDGDRVVYARGFGTRSADTGEPVTPDMLFRVGSLSKVVAALAIVAEAKARSIPLDAPIGRYMSGLSPRVGAVTLHQLLSHTAGVREEITATPITDQPDPRELVRQARAWNDSLLFTTPGDVMSYSNLGYALAGALIETVSRKPYADVVRERVFDPLGMSRATYSANVATGSPYSEGHVGARGAVPTVVRPIRTDARYLPPTFLWASVRDLARLEIALMNHGRIDGCQALDSGVVARVETPQVKMPAAGGDQWYGYGLIVHDANGVRRLNHGGRIDGYFAALDMAPATRRGFVLLSNRMDLAPLKTLTELLSVESPALAKDAATAASRVAPAEWPAEALTGRYANGSWAFAITREGNVTRFRGRFAASSDRDIDGVITAVSNDLIRVTFNDPVTNAPTTRDLSVVRDEGGRVKYLWIGDRAARRQ